MTCRVPHYITTGVVFYRMLIQQSKKLTQGKYMRTCSTSSLLSSVEKLSFFWRIFLYTKEEGLSLFWSVLIGGYTVIAFMCMLEDIKDTT